jgi:hypothetical protein
MERDPDILRVAEAMIRTYGGRAMARMAERSAGYLRDGDVDSGRFWWRVALVVRAVQQSEAADAR